ncbi:MAG: ABC transporter permease, partial [Parvibaculaceae bacterium]
GTGEFRITGVIAQEPDRINDGLAFGPRVMMSRAALDATGLVQPGSLVTWKYRIKMPFGTTLGQVREVVRQAREDYRDSGWRVRHRGSAAPGADEFVDRLSFFMTLVGLTALIIGGAGIANAASAFVNRRMDAIATLKCLGATSSTVNGIYLVEMFLVALIAIIIGLCFGAVAPWIAHLTLANILPLPVTAQVEYVPLGLAAVFGLLITLIFTVWPLSRTRRVPASALFRQGAVPVSARPSLVDLAIIAGGLVATALLIYASFDERRITSYFLGGLAGSFIVLLGLAAAIVKIAALIPKPRGAIWRYALSNIHRPGSAAASVILALGLGLSLFVTITLTDRTISTELTSGLPKSAPAFFFLDVRNEELEPFMALLKGTPGVGKIDTAPMLRGRMIALKGVPVEKAKIAPDAQWAIRGDRGLTYSDGPLENAKLEKGEWWPKDYSGPPLLSFAGELAEGLGLTIGDEVTVNVLGRDVTGKIVNLRQVNWRSLEINFAMVFSANALKGAPHQTIVTAVMDGGDEAKLLNQVARQFPTVTAVRVKDVIATVSTLLGQMLAAIRGANAMTLFTGVLVLAGALAAGLSGRLYDAVVLKTYGATRRQLLLAFIAEYAVLGLAAAVFGIATGALGSWFLAYWVLEMTWSFSWTVAVLTALIAMVLAIAAGLTVTWRALTVKPAPMLRNE